MATRTSCCYSPWQKLPDAEKKSTAMYRLLFLTALCATLSTYSRAKAATDLHAAHHADTFEAGLASLYGFDEVQAQRFFAQGADEGCAMCHWGIAYAAVRLAAFYQPPDDVLPRGYDALLQAEALAAQHGCTLVQNGLLLATRAYYHRWLAHPAVPTEPLGAYVDLMRRVYRQFAADPDVATLFATGLLSVVNPSCHQPQTGFFAETAEIFAVLEPALAQHPEHIGLHHIYIHAREASTHPERALPSAYALPRLAPRLGHLVHMPSHIFARLGMYEDAAQANRDAIAVDLRARADGADHTVYTTVLTLHNYHFLWSMLSLRGKYDAALDVAREVRQWVAELALPANMWRDILLSFEMLTHIEMERWHEARQTTLPPQAGSYLEAITGLGHGLAALHADDAPAYQNARETLQAHLRQSTSMTPRAGDIRIAAILLDAEAARLSQRWDDAWAAYRQAISYEDAIPYQEPWPWQVPVRNYLARALIDCGAFEDAVQACDEELAKHPRAPKTTRLLAEALQASGNPRMHTLPGR